MIVLNFSNNDLHYQHGTHPHINHHRNNLIHLLFGTMAKGNIYDRINTHAISLATYAKLSQEKNSEVDFFKANLRAEFDTLESLMLELHHSSVGTMPPNYAAAQIEK